MPSGTREAMEFVAWNWCLRENQPGMPSQAAHPVDGSSERDGLEEHNATGSEGESAEQIRPTVFERWRQWGQKARPRSCGSRAPPLRHKLQTPSSVTAGTEEWKSGQAHDAKPWSEPVDSPLFWARRRFVKWTELTPLPPYVHWERYGGQSSRFHAYYTQRLDSNARHRCPRPLPHPHPILEPSKFV